MRHCLIVELTVSQLRTAINVMRLTRVGLLSLGCFLRARAAQPGQPRNIDTVVGSRRNNSTRPPAIAAGLALCIFVGTPWLPPAARGTRRVSSSDVGRAAFAQTGSGVSHAKRITIDRHPSADDCAAHAVLKLSLIIDRAW